MKSRKKQITFKSPILFFLLDTVSYIFFPVHFPGLWSFGVRTLDRHCGVTQIIYYLFQISSLFCYSTVPSIYIFVRVGIFYYFSKMFITLLNYYFSYKGWVYFYLVVPFLLHIDYIWKCLFTRILVDIKQYLSLLGGCIVI